MNMYIITLLLIKIVDEIRNDIVKNKRCLFFRMIIKKIKSSPHVECSVLEKYSYNLQTKNKTKNKLTKTNAIQTQRCGKSN